MREVQRAVGQVVNSRPEITEVHADALDGGEPSLIERAGHAKIIPAVHRRVHEDQGRVTDHQIARKKRSGEPDIIEEQGVR